MNPKILFVLYDGTTIDCNSELDKLTIKQKQLLEDYKHRYNTMFNNDKSSKTKSIIIYEDGTHVII